MGHAGRRRGDRALGREGLGRSRDLGHVPGYGLRGDDAEALVVAERGEHGGGVDGRRRAARRGPVRDDGGRAARARDELEARRVEGVELRAAAEDRVERRRRRAAGVVEEEGRCRPRVVGDARDDGPRGQAAGRAADGQRVRRRDGEHDGVEGLRDARARRPLRRRDDDAAVRHRDGVDAAAEAHVRGPRAREHVFEDVGERRRGAVVAPEARPVEPLLGPGERAVVRGDEEPGAREPGRLGERGE